MSATEATSPVPEVVETPATVVTEEAEVVPQVVEETSAEPVPEQTEAEVHEEEVATTKEEKPVKEKRKSTLGNLFGKLGKKETKSSTISEEEPKAEAEEVAAVDTEAEATPKEAVTSTEATIQTPPEVTIEAAPEEEKKEEVKQDDASTKHQASLIEKLLGAFKSKDKAPKQKKEKKSTEAATTEVVNEKQASEVTPTTEIAVETPAEEKPKKRFSTRFFGGSPKKENPAPLAPENHEEPIVETPTSPVTDDAPQLPEPTAETQISEIGDLENTEPVISEQPPVIEATA